MNILRNDAIQNQSFSSQAFSYAPLLTDIGAAMVFGLGFYFFKKHFSGFTHTKLQNAEESLIPEKPQKDSYKPIREKIEFTISKWDSEISLQKINSIIKKELDESNFDPFGILDQLHKNNLNADISTINTLLDTCTKLNDFKNFNRLCELIIDSENYLNSNMPAANIVTFNIILKGLNNDMCKMEFEERYKFLAPAKVEFLLKEILSRNLHPNDITLNTIIDMLVESGNFGLAWKYYEEMEKEYSIEPDIFTYSTLLKSIKNYQPDEESIEKAFEILKIVRLSQAKGVKPDEIFYNCILETCVKYGKMEAADVVFNDMKENALITPSKITYSIMIKGFGNNANLEKCFILFHEMKQYSLEPNEIIYGCLLNACVKANNLFKAVEVFNEIKNYSGLSMNVYIYTILIKGYSKSKDFAKAIELYNQMLNDTSLTLNIIVFNAILDCCVECFDIEMMKKIYEDLRRRAVLNETFPQPDLITYSTVIKGYAKVRDSSKVLDIFYYLCGRDDLQLDEIIYCSVLDALLKTERVSEALKIYEQMKTGGITRTNASYSIIIKIFSKLNEVEKAVQIYNDMISEKIQPSLITYTAIIQILIKTKRVGNAIQIFEEILQNKINPDQVLYNVIINGCVLNGKLDEGCKFLLEAFKQEIRVCDDVYYNILNNLLTNRTLDPLYKNDLTYKICQEMTFRGLEIEYELYNKVVRMLNSKFQINHNNNYNQQNNNYNHNQSSFYENSHYEPSCYENNNNGYKYDRNYKEKYIRNKKDKDCNETVLNEDQSIYDFVEKRISTNLNLQDRNENKYTESFNHDKNTHYSKNFQNKNTRKNNYNRNVYDQSVYGNNGNKNQKEFECEFNY
jgi:pentatricopeptide repeat protein